MTRARPKLRSVVCGVLLTVGIAGCGRALPTAAQIAGASSGAAAVAGLSATTNPPTRSYTRPVVWATYRMVDTLDPIQAFDYPEDTVDTALCDSVLGQAANGEVGPGLAVATYTTPTTLVLNLRSGPRFWDGHPVTAADVAFSLQRAANPKDGGFYAGVFARVKSIVATTPTEVTIILHQPDFWLEGELSQMSGMVVEKAYVEREGAKFGTPQGGTMCSGPYELKRWIAGQELVAVANPHYWNAQAIPLVHEIVFKGVADDASLTAGLETGAIQGTYPTNISTLGVLEQQKNLKVSLGPSFDVDAMVIANLKGALGDVKVRQALSMAIDREAYIQAIYHGDAQLPRTLENPGTWGYGADVFAADWKRLPDPTVNVTKAAAMIKAAHAVGHTLVIGTSEEVTSLATAANLVRQAGEQIGLKVVIRSVSPSNFINFFTEASARKGIDLIPTSNYGDYADPAALYNEVAAPDGSENYDGFSNPGINAALDAARSAANPDRRAADVARAGDLIAQQLPWIPLAAPDSILVTNRSLTGAPDSFVYMGGPWANLMGGA